MSVATETRHADLTDMVQMLREQHARKVDVVAPASAIAAKDGQISLSGVDPMISEEGVTEVNGLYRPTRVFDEGIAEKLGVPLSYVRKMRDRRPDLYDANVNGWLHGRRERRRKGHRNGIPFDELISEPIPGDERSFLLRMFKGDDGEPGIGRAFLSNSYSIMDNIDVLMAALDGVRKAGVDVQIDGCDLTDRRMYVRVVCPEVKALAPTLLRDYRSPWGPELERWKERVARTGIDYGQDDDPIVFAGFEISNSEVGSGAFSITPRMVVKVCANGMKMTQDAMRSVHLGARLEHGLIKWTQDTEQKNLALVQAKTRDAVSTFLDTEYVEKVIAGIEEKSETVLPDSSESVKVIAKKMQYTEEETKGILAHFTRHGHDTAGGVFNAITSYAQLVDDADAAAALEDSAVKALGVAASL